MSEEDKKETAKKAVKTPKTKEVKAVTAKKKSVKTTKKSVKTTKKSVKEVEIPLVDEEVKDKVIPKEIEADEISEENLFEEEKGDAIIEENLVEEEKNRVEPFDWEEAVKDDIYSVEERADLEKEYTSTLTEIIDKQVLDGTVVTITDREVVVDINFKSDGVISFNEFKYNIELKVGDTVEVLVEKQEDKNGQLVLSHRRARVLRAWEKVNDALETGEVVNGQISSRTKGGMIVDVFGIECFLPGSQIDVKPIRDYDDYVGKKMEFKIVKVNEAFRNVVVSHKALIEADLAIQTKDIMSKLEKGQVLEGTVKNITSYGVFVDLGGIDGLIHITDLSWGRISHPEEIVSLDETINVVILEFDEAKSRIQLGLKQLGSHPWDSLDENLKIGDEVEGKVVVVADYGVFVELQTGVEALLHVSEMSWSTHLRSANDFYKKGDVLKAKIITLDKETRKMSLGVKQLTPDPWTDIAANFPIGSKHSVLVKNFTNFGIFVELVEGIDGLVHISDLSWTKKIKHPAEFTQVDARLDVIVLEIDKENRKISLGHKQLDENPWDEYAKKFIGGEDYEATVIEVFDKGALISLSDEVEAFVPRMHCEKEDGSLISLGEKLNFRILEFSKENRKILASHSVIFKQELEAARKKSAKATKKVMKKMEDDKKQSTLGDLDTLAALKEDIESNK
ncbi:MAG: 30S ribosomal protein S1 [Flavobacteriales bacterium]|nr:30S ribosomal protein S1 [Flavobacteriales bacterium]|tara:strand:+ start:329 stop:2365 length:2037 start_codon:yes stop_codon:yes gene_type:complete